ncbi:MAG: AsmA-like C-terminal domain-containing protein, partial [Nitrospirota bacterium]|nr:AsmA-like C-terminal domain-containing protein [Nitrospirota bacterium]
HQALLRDPRSQPLLQPGSLYHDARGNIHISTRIEGPLTNPSQLKILEGDLLLDGIQLNTSSDWLPVSQLTGHMTFDTQQIRLHRFNGKLGNSPIDIKGQWSFRKDSKASNLTMESMWSSIDLQTLFPSVGQTFSTFEGSLGTTLTLSGSSLRPDYHAAFDFTNIALATKGLFQKPSGVPAIVKAQGTIKEDKTIKMTKGTLSIPPYSLEAQGQLSWSDRAYIRGLLQTESGTGAMFPQGVIIGDGRLNLSSLGLTWGLEGKNWDWTTWSMKGQVEGSSRSAESTTSNAKEKIQTASFQWAQKNQKGKGALTMEGIPIESLLAPRAASPPPLTGTTFIKTSLHMNLESSETRQRSLTGKGNVRLQKGRIQTGPVLSKILGILNVPSLLMGKVNLLEEGLPFDELIGSFSIDNGLLTTKDLALKSPVLKLTAAGTYDLPTENLDSMIAVSPFGAYSNLLKDIPLFGSLMKGERKGLLTALFEVKGPRTKPEVTYLPLESFAGGLKGFAQFPIDVLKNIITLPLPEKKTPELMAPPK